MIKSTVKAITPRPVLQAYHWCLSKFATLYYGNPSSQLIVIGVTGTNGKTTTCDFIWQYLQFLGKRAGLATTVRFSDGGQDWLNDKKMTMLGRFQTQRLLADMLKKGCEYAIIETSSQGIEQFRHSGINYDLVVFTNLTPEHIEAHGSFENYRAMKEKLFDHLVKSNRKKINDQEIPKMILSNADDKETERLRNFKADQFLTYSINQPADYQAMHIDDVGRVNFQLQGTKIQSNFIGRFSIYNMLAAISAVATLGFDVKDAANCILGGVPGRQELIDMGQGFDVMVDYAPEPEGLKNLYKALDSFGNNKLIHVLGSAGGGRDQARQKILGQMAGEKADIVIVTNEDPYDDDPMKIINEVAMGATMKDKVEGKNLFKILDRGEAITKAISLAEEKDLVLITGKGAEQAICVAGGKKIPWDDREVVRKILQNR